MDRRCLPCVYLWALVELLLDLADVTESHHRAGMRVLFFLSARVGFSAHFIFFPSGRRARNVFNTELGQMHSLNMVAMSALLLVCAGVPTTISLTKHVRVLNTSVASYTSHVVPLDNLHDVRGFIDLA